MCYNDTYDCFYFGGFKAMIKMIATDMDGTLLNSKKQLTQNSIRVISAVKNMGIHFVVASGRQYYNIYNVFKQHNLDENVSFLAENGTIVFDKGKLLFANKLDDDLVKSAVELVRKTPNIYPVLCGVDFAYIEDTHPKFVAEVTKYFDRRKFLPDVLQCLQHDKITKIALLDVTANSETYAYPIFKHFEKHAQILISGPEWVDLINKGVNKGSSVEMIGDLYSYNFDQRMAFGDYLNDVALLKSCKYSFAVENAHENLKKVAYKICPSNDQEGVAKTLIEWFNLKF